MRIFLLLLFSILTLQAQTDSVKTDSTKAMESLFISSGFQNVRKTADVIKRTEIRESDYRNANEILRNLANSVYYDKGYFGQPSLLIINGYSGKNLGYSVGGMNLNNSISGAYEANNILTEEIDSIAVENFVKSFMNSENKPIALNFVPLDYIPKVPETSLRILEGPNSEGYVDGRFNALVLPRLSLSFDINNASVDTFYANTEYYYWKGNLKARYMISSKTNILGEYFYNRSYNELSGGYNPAKADIYKNIEAKPFFSNKYKKNRENRFSLKILNKSINNLPVNLTAYFRDSFDEFRQNEQGNNKENLKIVTNESLKIWGLSGNTSLYVGNQIISVKGIYEHREMNSGYLQKSFNYNFTSVSGELNLDFFNLANINIFGKSSNYLGDYNANKNLFGLGFLFETNFKKLNLFGGASTSDNGYSIYELTLAKGLTKANSKKINVGLKYEIPDLSIKADYFISDSKDELFAFTNLSTDSTYNINTIGYLKDDITRSGVNFTLKYSLSSFHLDNRSTLYFNSEYKRISLPEFTSTGSLYYIGLLFEENLNLKAGINYYLIGKHRANLYDEFLNEEIVAYQDNYGNRFAKNNFIDTNLRLDLFAAATLQENATLYFTLENILNKDFYFVENYPVQKTAFRFGVTWYFYN